MSSIPGAIAVAGNAADEPERYRARFATKEVARLRMAGLNFRNEIVTRPGGSQILLVDSSGNLLELFEPAKST
ncbi:hypothetical protein [Mesorhizobium sp. CA12]|uniref:hypothetical protein n=1 Tax=Mesorhizobium sp. CA12 TaxID=2876644 RepID=UPI00398D5AD5